MKITRIEARIVRSQILIAQGKSLHDPPVNIPHQHAIERRGVAMQCRVTTEDPDRHFIPDYGRITTYRSAGGFAVRLDGGNGFGGAVITPYFDSLLVKVTTWGATLAEETARLHSTVKAQAEVSWNSTATVVSPARRRGTATGSYRWQ